MFDVGNLNYKKITLKADEKYSKYKRVHKLQRYIDSGATPSRPLATFTANCRSASIDDPDDDSDSDARTAPCSESEDPESYPKDIRSRTARFRGGSIWTRSGSGSGEAGGVKSMINCKPACSSAFLKLLNCTSRS